MVRLRVKVEVGGEVFRTSLFTATQRGGHFLLVNKKMQKAAGARVGAMVDFTIAPDLEERTPTVPPELAKLLKTEKKLAKWYEGLSEPIRWEVAKWIDGVKSAEVVSALEPAEVEPLPEELAAAPWVLAAELDWM